MWSPAAYSTRDFNSASARGYNTLLCLRFLPGLEVDVDERAVLMLGAGGHGRVVADIIRCCGLQLAGIIDDVAAAGSERLGSRVLGGCQQLPQIMRETGCRQLVLAIGHNGRRLELAQHIEALCPQVIWQTLVHPAAVVAADAVLGGGSVVVARAVLNPGARLGRHCIVNTAAVVDHDCSLGDGSSLGPGAVLGGNVRLGKGAVVAIGATVINALQLGEHSLLGAGGTAVRDLPDFKVALGVPAHVVRERRALDDYL